MGGKYDTEGKTVSPATVSPVMVVPRNRAYLLTCGKYFFCGDRWGDIGRAKKFSLAEAEQELLQARRFMPGSRFAIIPAP